MWPSIPLNSVNRPFLNDSLPLGTESLATSIPLIVGVAEATMREQATSRAQTLSESLASQSRPDAVAGETFVVYPLAAEIVIPEYMASGAHGTKRKTTESSQTTSETPVSRSKPDGATRATFAVYHPPSTDSAMHEYTASGAHSTKRKTTESSQTTSETPVSRSRPDGETRATFTIPFLPIIKTDLETTFVYFFKTHLMHLIKTDLETTFVYFFKTHLMHSHDDQSEPFIKLIKLFLEQKILSIEFINYLTAVIVLISVGKENLGEDLFKELVEIFSHEYPLPLKEVSLDNIDYSNLKKSPKLCLAFFEAFHTHLPISPSLSKLAPSLFTRFLEEILEWNRTGRNAGALVTGADCSDLVYFNFIAYAIKGLPIERKAHECYIEISRIWGSVPAFESLFEQATQKSPTPIHPPTVQSLLQLSLSPQDSLGQITEITPQEAEMIDSLIAHLPTLRRQNIFNKTTKNLKCGFISLFKILLNSTNYNGNLFIELVKSLRTRNAISDNPINCLIFATILASLKTWKFKKKLYDHFNEEFCAEYLLESKKLPLDEEDLDLLANHPAFCQDFFDLFFDPQQNVKPRVAKLGQTSLQAFIGEIFEKIEKGLDRKEIALFFGLPCFKFLLRTVQGHPVNENILQSFIKILNQPFEGTKEYAYFCQYLFNKIWSKFIYANAQSPLSTLLRFLNQCLETEEFNLNLLFVFAAKIPDKKAVLQKWGGNLAYLGLRNNALLSAFADFLLIFEYEEKKLYPKLYAQLKELSYDPFSTQRASTLFSIYLEKTTNVEHQNRIKKLLSILQPKEQIQLAP